MTISIADSTALDTGLTDIADAIRAKGGRKDKLQFPDEFVDAVENMDVTRWSKPADWPDLYALELPTDHAENVIYLLYDRKCGIDAVSLSTVNKGVMTVDRGTVVDGEFVGDRVAENVSTYTDTLTDEYTVYRLSGTFRNYSLDTYKTESSYWLSLQAAVWIRGHVPVLTDFGNGSLSIHTQAFEMSDAESISTLTFPAHAFNKTDTGKFELGVNGNGDFGGRSITRVGGGPMFYQMRGASDTLVIKNAVFDTWNSPFQYVTRVRFENVTIDNFNGGWRSFSYAESPRIVSVEFDDDCVVNCTGVNMLFYQDSQLKTCDLHAVDFSNCTSGSSPFIECRSLETLRLNDTWRVDLNLRDCIYMPKSTVIQLFNDLGTIDTTHTITLPYGMKNYLLTPEEIAVVTEKGWTVA